MLKRLLVIVLLLSPAVAWALYKPIRVVAPQLVSAVSCNTKTICLDDTARFDEAQHLYNEALRFVESSVASVKNKPRVIFCSTEACYQSFGFVRSSASIVGTLGIVVSPRGWDQYRLRHEMIHHVQAERLGMYRQWGTPVWFKEGMAYSLSEDPRAKLTEPFQQYRARFEQWYRSVGRKRLWAEAKKL
jgi:hypothetical protein